MHGILVAGMHRSGTSAVGHLLSAAGVVSGPPELQMPPNFANPAGFAELEPIVEFNDDALERRGWFWDAPPSEPSFGVAESAELVDRGRALAATSTGSSEWYLKDPRFSLLLPLWRQILVDRFVVVFTVRPALEVAWSLAVRDGFSMSLGLALWSAYYRHLAAGLDGIPTVAVDYVSLSEEPLETTARLLSALRDLKVDVEADPAVAARAINHGLRRATMPSDVARVAPPMSFGDLLPGFEPAPVVVFERFDLRARSPEPWEVDILDEHRLRRRVQDDLDRESAVTVRVTAERDSLSAERDSLSAETDRLAAERDSLSAETDRLSAERDLLVAQRDSLSAETDAARAEGQERDADMTRLTAELERIAAQRDGLAARVNQVEDERERLIAERDRIASERQLAIEDRDARDELIRTYETSSSWRLTAPARAAGRALRAAFRARPEDPTA